MAEGETPSLTGEFVGETHSVLEHTQTHPPGNQHQKGPIWLWVAEEVTENRQREEQAALLPLRPLPYIQRHNKLRCVALPWNSRLCGLSCFPVVPPGLSAGKCETTQSASCCFAPSPLSPSCLSPTGLDECFLTPWLLDFHTVWFSGSSGCFLFLNLLSVFWLCKEARCIYLLLHLGRKSFVHIIFF